MFCKDYTWFPLVWPVWDFRLGAAKNALCLHKQKGWYCYKGGKIFIFTYFSVYFDPVMQRNQNIVTNLLKKNRWRRRCLFPAVVERETGYTLGRLPVH